MIDILRNMVTRVFVNRSGERPQVEWFGGRVTPDATVLEPQGLHFVAPAGAGGAQLAPGGDPSNAVLVGLGGSKPADSIAEGEGGLHLLGTFKIFLAADGTLHLGAKDPSDFVALAGPVADALQALSDRIAVFEAAFAGWTVVAMDGGAALKASYTGSSMATGPGPGTIASATVKVE